MEEDELEIEEEDEFVKKLKEKLKKLNQNKEFVSFLSREEDIEFQMNSERSEGIDEGINIGKNEMVKKMLKEKIDISTIIKISGLTLKEIEGLK